MKNNTETALATASDSAIQAQQTNGEFALPNNQFELELMQDLMQSEAEIESLAMRSVNSKDLIGKEFAIIDAMFSTIKEKEVEKVCVNFVLELTDGETVTCLKSSNKFNDAYVNFFNKFRGIANRRLDGYTFEEDARWTFAGNAAIVLRKVPKTIKAVK